jgi:hypothetical protein
MRRFVPLLLLSLVLLAVFLGLEPLLLYAAWGSDTGEYYRLTLALAQNGRFLLAGYHGWGFGYPYFPGIFEVGAAVSQATGANALISLEVAVPALAALSVAPVFLLFRRLYPSDTVALVGAAFAAVAFPRLFDLSHAAPLSLGDLLCVASLWAFVEQRKDRRWLVVLSLSAGALIITHHLSSYFFFISALGVLVLHELLFPRRWASRFPAREFLFLGGFVTVLFTYWLVYAPPFSSFLSQGVLGANPAVVPAGAATVVVLSGLLVYLRRRGGAGRPVGRLKWPGRRSIYLHMAILGVLVFGSLALLTVFPLPTTTDTISPFTLLWYTPFLLLIPLAAGSRRLSNFSTLGMVTILWILVLGGSALYGLVTANPVILPERHPEYLAIPLSLMVAISLRHLIGPAQVGRMRPRQAVAVGLVALLLGANALVAFPPPSALEGFQEGFTPQDLTMIEWAASSLPPGSALAADHRLSDLYFGLSGQPATWDTTPCLFLGDNRTCARAELNASLAPRGPDQEPRPLDAVAVDWTMVHVGVALDPNAPASPMSPQALAALNGPGFVLLYEDGQGEMLFWVAPGS